MNRLSHVCKQNKTRMLIANCCPILVCALHLLDMIPRCYLLFIKNQLNKRNYNHNTIEGYSSCISDRIFHDHAYATVPLQNGSNRHETVQICTQTVHITSCANYKSGCHEVGKYFNLTNRHVQDSTLHMQIREAA